MSKLLDNGDFIVNDKLVLTNIHSPSLCAGQPCVVHNPAVPPSEDVSLHWREDRGIFERICKHGVGHPAVEQLHYWRKNNMQWMSVHGCCSEGCCYER